MAKELDPELRARLQEDSERIERLAMSADEAELLDARVAEAEANPGGGRRASEVVADLRAVADVDAAKRARLAKQREAFEELRRLEEELEQF